MQSIIKDLIRADNRLWFDVARDLVDGRPELEQLQRDAGDEPFGEECYAAFAIAKQLLGFAMHDHYFDMIPLDRRVYTDCVATRR